MSNLKTLEALMNSELEKVKKWCDVNKLSINMAKTNFMIIKSARKKDMPVNIQIRKNDGTIHSLDRQDHIKYLGIIIDDSISWKYHISYICSKISRNIGIISQLRHYLSVKQVRQIYFNLIYPFISYAILAWGSTYNSHLQKVQIKQNHVATLIFFATTHGKDVKSAHSLLNLLDILTVHNVYCLHALKFTHLWHKGFLPNIFCDIFQYASSIHSYNTRYATQQNLYKPRIRTNTGKQMISFVAIDLWKKIPQHFKDLNAIAFSKQIERYLLAEQHLY